MKQLLLVAPERFGMMEAILLGLKKYTVYEIDFLDLQTPTFRYKNFSQRVHNFFLKKFKKTNLKKTYHEKIIGIDIEQLREHYDTILIIRPDMIEDHNLNLLRNKTNFFVAYYWDSVEFFPRKIIIKDWFDRVYSFDPEDCKKYGYTFLSNFYFYENKTAAILYQVYNLSTYDRRHSVLEKIAEKLEALNVSFCFKAYREKHFESKYTRQVFTLMNYTEMLEEIAAAEILLDLHKANQTGLTFRPFEAMGLNKKLITTNKNIKDYDFFDEQNILIIDEQNPVIPASFFEKPYTELPPAIKEKYHLKNWINILLTR